MKIAPRMARMLAFVLIGWLSLFTPGLALAADPAFPPLTGRVVDQAELLDAASRASITAKLASLEADTGAQLVVVTLSDLQGYEIEDYGYRLGRAWGIGDAETNRGALLIIAPTERKVRIEVGYGLEPVLTDAMSSHIIQSAILPDFRAGAFRAGTEAGIDAIIEQVRLDPAEAEARIAALEPEDAEMPIAVAVLILLVFVFMMLGLSRAAGGRRGRRRGRGLGPILVWAASDALRSSGRSGGGSFGGGGGFSGGGGSFGGGGASGGW